MMRMRTNILPSLDRILQIRIGKWPVYSFLIALGQIIASNSYQITLLTGEIGQTADKLYIVATIYLVTSIMWGVLARYVKNYWILSTPFALYGTAFLLIGLSPLLPTFSGRGWMQNVATGLYAAASSSGALFFSLNFGDEGMSTP